MTIAVTERQLEDLIEKTLLDSGYEKGTESYDRKLAIDNDLADSCQFHFHTYGGYF